MAVFSKRAIVKACWGFPWLIKIGTKEKIIEELLPHLSLLRE
jgi:hypothetical protein